MATYRVLHAVVHGTTADDSARHEAGETIELTEAQAGPLLDIGSIEGPVEVPADNPPGKKGKSA